MSHVPILSSVSDTPCAPEYVHESTYNCQYIVTRNVKLLFDMDVFSNEDKSEDDTNFALESAYNTAVTSDKGEPQTFKEMMNCKNAALWKLNLVNNFLYQKAWAPIKLSTYG